MIIPPETEQAPISYRFRRGSKLADMPPVPPEAPVPPLSSFDGPFQLAEFLSLKVRHDPHDIKGLVEVPTDNVKAADKHAWIYEHLRRIPIDATPLVTQLLTLCNRETCPEMKANEWQYLCVAHNSEGPNKCCAIDYILHALDSTTALLSSSSYFPSRLQIPHASLAHFPSLFRRLSRMFAHSYFHHREAFATAEAETSLYARFVALCERYELVGSNLLIIPQEGYEVLSQDEDLGDDHPHDDDDDEDGDWDDEVSADSDNYRGDGSPRGREKEDDGSVGRSHSLGRHPAPPYQSPGKWTSSPVQPANKGKPAPAQASESLSPPSTRAQLSGHVEEEEPQQTPTILPGKGRGTLSRGKAPRAANLWTAEDMPGDKSEATDAEDKELPQMGMARKESAESVVYVGKDGEEQDSSDAEAEKEEKPEDDAKVESRAEASKVEAKEEAKAESKVETKEESKAEVKVEDEPKLETKIEEAKKVEPVVPESEAPAAPSILSTDAAISSAAESEPLPIPQAVTKPRSPSPQKLMTPPKPPAAASPGKASPAPAQASPTVTSPPTLSATLPEKSTLASPVNIPSPPSKKIDEPSLADTGKVIDLGVSPKTTTKELQSEPEQKNDAAADAATAPVAVPTPASITLAPTTETSSSSLEVPGADVLGTSPKSELQARPGMAVSPKSINKRNPKNRKNKKGNNAKSEQE